MSQESNETVDQAMKALASEHRRRADDATKEAVKEALKEWLDEKYSAFGKWSFHGLLAMALVGAVYLFMISNGWHK